MTTTAPQSTYKMCFTVVCSSMPQNYKQNYLDVTQAILFKTLVTKKPLYVYSLPNYASYFVLILPYPTQWL